MKELFDGAYSPITNEIGFIQCSAKKAVAAFVEWQTPIQAKRGVSLDVVHSNGEMAEALNMLLPLTSIERRRMLFIQLANEWTAFFDNGWRGTDVFSQVSYLCSKIGCRGVRVGFVPDLPEDQGGQKKVRYGATIFEMYASNTTDFMNIERSISSLNDGGKWTFSAAGAEQPFEDVGSYELKSKKDRFTPEMLERYVNALGIDAFNPSCYQSSGGFFLINKSGPSAHNMESYSLEDARTL